MSKLPIANLIDSPYRDRVTFPVDPSKIKGLVESIHQTGFWDNLLCRFKSNKTKDGVILNSPEEVEAYLAGPEFDASQETFELAYGHHRLDAVIVVGMLEIDIPVKWIVNETMLRIMSNENKAGWGSSITAKLETVRQVKEQIEAQISPYDDHKEYTAAGMSFFDYNSFEKAQSYGVGYRVVKQFLGVEWSMSDVRIPMQIMASLDRGWFQQTDLKPVPSLGLMEVACSSMAAMYDGASIRQTTPVVQKDDKGEIIMDGDKPKTKNEQASVEYAAPNWPDYYKERAIEKLLWFVSIPDDEVDQKTNKVKKTFSEARATVARMKSIRKAILTHSAFPGGKGTAAFDVNKKVKEEFFEKLAGDYEDQESRDAAYKELSTTMMDHFLSVKGFKGWSGYDAMLESINAYIEKIKIMPEENSDQLNQNDIDSSDEYVSSESFTEENQETSNVITGLFEDDKNQETGETVALLPGKAVSGMMIALKGVDTGCQKLIECQAGINMEQEEKFEELMTTALKNLATTYVALVGRENLNTLVSEVMVATQE